MNPAFSIVFLTTLIGCGQGVFIATVFGVTAMGSAGRELAILASAVSLLFLMAGLIASFFHLGRPERAWRAIACWRTSWLSREIIILGLTIVLIALYGLLHWFGIDQTTLSVRFVGWIGVGMAILLYVCTAMIYACIKFLQEWATPLTVINFSLLGLCSGFTLATGLAYSLDLSISGLFLVAAMVTTALAMVMKIAALVRNARLKARSTVQSAIGIKHRQVTQRSMGHTGGSFNTRAFFHHCSDRLIRNMRSAVLISVFVVPLVLLGLSPQFDSSLLLWAALIVQFAGLIGERWLFFAQANHPQNLYYQTVG